MTATSKHPTLTLPQVEAVVDFNRLIAFGASLTGTVVVSVKIPKGSKVVSSHVLVETVFVGTGVTNLGLTAGVNSGDVDRYLLTADLIGGATGYDDLGGQGVAVTGHEIEAVETEVGLAFTAIGANLDQMTAGKLRAVIHYADLD